jgi:hypothetical protein
MADNDEAQNQGIPVPDPAIKRLDRLVGTWRMKGRPLGSDEDSITGTTAFSWLHDTNGKAFFLQQDMEMDYDGMTIKSRELIGYNPRTEAFSSYVFSNLSGDALPYEWDIRDDTLTISVTYGSMDATFTGKFSPDGNSFSGGWRPNPGADEAINAPYHITVTSIK